LTSSHIRGACIDPHRYDAGKKIKGKKRHILVDTVGLLLHAINHPADIQDRDGGVLVMATLFGMFPFLKTLFADSGYQGPKFAKALAKVLPHLDIEIVKRSDQVSGFVVLPKRRIVERTIVWLNRCRRLATDWENLNRETLSFLHLASIRLMLRKLCNPARRLRTDSKSEIKAAVADAESWSTYMFSFEPLRFTTSTTHRQPGLGLQMEIEFWKWAGS
jgi:transposase